MNIRNNIAKDGNNPVERRIYEAYSLLTGIFPSVDSAYILKLCSDKPFAFSSNCTQVRYLRKLVDHILVHGSRHPKCNKKKSTSQLKTTTTTTTTTTTAATTATTAAAAAAAAAPDSPIILMSMSFDDQCDYLRGLFPDANPNFLRRFVESNANKEKSFHQFIRENLESPEYPTAKEYKEQIKLTEQQKQYTSGFKVENFLEIFPEPQSYFENVDRKTKDQPVVLEFLKSFFNTHKEATITAAYKKFNCNASLAAKSLRDTQPDANTERESKEVFTVDIPLLQEFAYIKNKHRIITHMERLKVMNEQLFQELKKNNFLLTCQCCFSDECMPDKCAECNAGHVFCFNCVARGVDSTLARGETKVGCFTDCKSEFSLGVLQKSLPPTKFSTLLKNTQAAEVEAAGIDGLVSCPFCPFASIPPAEDKVFKCLNPECMKESCRKCKKLNHIPLKCDHDEKMRHKIEERMTEALVRSCHKCKRKFLKSTGCNKMTCQCGAMQCYVCDKAVFGYDHFFQGGSANSKKCKLFTDDKKIEADRVVKVTNELTAKLQKRNSTNAKIGTNKSPINSSNTDQLMEHIRRLSAPLPRKIRVKSI